MIYLKLFLTFLKIGAVAFGGGYGMISIIRDEVINEGWLTETEFLDMVAVSESTPGPIAVNMATFVGSSQGGLGGALLATLGVILPAFLIMLIITAVAKNLMKFAGVKAFLSGVRPVVVGLILATALTMLVTVLIGFTKISDKPSFDWRPIVIGVLILATKLTHDKIRKKAISPILLIVISAALGLLFYSI